MAFSRFAALCVISLGELHWSFAQSTGNDGGSRRRRGVVEEEEVPLLDRLVDPDGDLFIVAVASVAGLVLLCCCCCLCVVLMRKKKAAPEKAAEEPAPAEEKVEEKVEEAKVEEEAVKETSPPPLLQFKEGEDVEDVPDSTDQDLEAATKKNELLEEVPSDGNSGWCCAPSACRREEVHVPPSSAGDTP